MTTKPDYLTRLTKHIQASQQAQEKHKAAAQQAQAAREAAAAEPEHEATATGHTMHGKWSEPGVPHKGWECIGIRDEGEPEHLCQMCESILCRYVHTMEHPDYADQLDVGCVCAGNMEEDLDAASRREERFKRTKTQRRRWLEREWKTSSAGNEYLNTRGFNVVIFPQGEFWSGRALHRDSNQKMFARLRYRTAEQAKWQYSISCWR